MITTQTNNQLKQGVAHLGVPHL